MYALYIVSAYFLGSIPFGLIISKMVGKDIRKEGSGNIGATNVLRVLGWKYGLPVFLLDISKGFLPAFYVWEYTDADLYIAMLAGIAAIIGHIFPVYLKFKGGKGVATGLGVFLGLAPLPAIIVLIVFVIAFLSTGYVSVGSISAAISLPIVIIVYNYYKAGLSVYPRYFIITSFVIALFVVYRHKSNIKRLMKGEEMRILYKKKKGTENE